MALYKNPSFLQKSDHEAFDKIHTPGAATPHSAIYHCIVCGREIVSETGKPLPPQNHHQHSPGAGAIRWQMILYPMSEAR